MTRYIDKYYLNGNVYNIKGIKRYQGTRWQPGANTVAYRPLEGDVKDHNTNGTYDWTVQGDVGYDVIDSGKTVMTLSGNGYCEQSNVCHPFDNQLEGPYTISLYIGNTVKKQSRWDNVGILEGRGSNDIGLLYWTNSLDPDPVAQATAQRIHISMPNANRPSLEDIPVTFPYNGFFHFVVTVDANYDHNYYINGQLVHTLTGYGPASYYIDGMLLGTDYADKSNRTFVGNLSEIIIEDVVWSAQDVEDYYNHTCEDYGLQQTQP